MTVTEPTHDTVEDQHTGVADDSVDHDQLVDDDVLVEEISIDGMCGVY